MVVDSMIIIYALEYLDKLGYVISEIKKLISKYYECKVIQDKLPRDLNIEDIKNNIFRYPENILPQSFNYIEMLKKVDEETIREIKTDIELLQNYFGGIGLILSLAK